MIAGGGNNDNGAIERGVSLEEKNARGTPSDRDKTGGTPLRPGENIPPGTNNGDVLLQRPKIPANAFRAV